MSYGGGWPPPGGYYVPSVESSYNLSGGYGQQTYQQAQRQGYYQFQPPPASSLVPVATHHMSAAYQQTTLSQPPLTANESDRASSSYGYEHVSNPKDNTSHQVTSPEASYRQHLSPNRRESHSKRLSPSSSSRRRDRSMSPYKRGDYGRPRTPSPERSRSKRRERESSRHAEKESPSSGLNIEDAIATLSQSGVNIDKLLQDERLKNVLFSGISMATQKLEESLNKETDDNVSFVKEASHSSSQLFPSASSESRHPSKSILKRKEERDASGDTALKLSALEKTLQLLRDKGNVEEKTESKHGRNSAALKNLSTYSNDSDDDENLYKSSEKNVKSGQPFWSVESVLQSSEEKRRGKDSFETQEKLFEQWRKTINLGSDDKKEPKLRAEKEPRSDTPERKGAGRQSQKKEEELDSTVQNILQSIGFNFDLSKRMQELAKLKKRETEDMDSGILDFSASFLDQEEMLRSELLKSGTSIEQLIKEARSTSSRLSKDKAHSRSPSVDGYRSHRENPDSTHRDKYNERHMYVPENKKKRFEHDQSQFGHRDHTPSSSFSERFIPKESKNEYYYPDEVDLSSKAPDLLSSLRTKMFDKVNVENLRLKVTSRPKEESPDKSFSHRKVIIPERSNKFTLDRSPTPERRSYKRSASPLQVTISKDRKVHQFPGDDYHEHSRHRDMPRQNEFGYEIENRSAFRDDERNKYQRHYIDLSPEEENYVSSSRRSRSPYTKYPPKLASSERRGWTQQGRYDAGSGSYRENRSTNLRKKSQSPVRHRKSRSPRRRRSKTPERRKFARSPNRNKSKSPIRRKKSRSPARRKKSRTPEKRRKSRSKSPRIKSIKPEPAKAAKQIKQKEPAAPTKKEENVVEVKDPIAEKIKKTFLKLPDFSEATKTDLQAKLMPMMPLLRDDALRDLELRQGRIKGLKSQLVKLKREQNEQMRKSRRNGLGEKDPILVVNASDQDTIKNEITRLSTAELNIELNDDLLPTLKKKIVRPQAKPNEKRKVDPPKAKVNLDPKVAAKKNLSSWKNEGAKNWQTVAVVDNILPEIELPPEPELKSVKKDDQKEDKPQRSVNTKNRGQVYFEYYDSGNNFCTDCGLTCNSLEQFFSHLHGKNHLAMVKNKKRPWLEEKAASTPKKKVGQAISKRIKGTEMMFPTIGFYCSLCKTQCLDFKQGEIHLMSQEHNQLYEKHIEKNPAYEREILLHQATIKKDKFGFSTQEIPIPPEPQQKKSDIKSNDSIKPEKCFRPKPEDEDTIEVVDMEIDETEDSQETSVEKRVVPKFTGKPNKNVLLNIEPTIPSNELKSSANDETKPLDEFINIKSEKAALTTIPIPLGPALPYIIKKKKFGPEKDDSQRAEMDDKKMMGIDVNADVEKPIAIPIPPESVLKNEGNSSSEKGKSLDNLFKKVNKSIGSNRSTKIQVVKTEKEELEWQLQQKKIQETVVKHKEKLLLKKKIAEEREKKKIEAEAKTEIEKGFSSSSSESELDSECSSINLSKQDEPEAVDLISSTSTNLTLDAQNSTGSGHAQSQPKDSNLSQEKEYLDNTIIKESDDSSQVIGSKDLKEADDFGQDFGFKDNAAVKEITLESLLKDDLEGANNLSQEKGFNDCTVLEESESSQDIISKDIICTEKVDDLGNKNISKDDTFTDGSDSNLEGIYMDDVTKEKDGSNQRNATKDDVVDKKITIDAKKSTVENNLDISNFKSDSDKLDAGEEIKAKENQVTNSPALKKKNVTEKNSSAIKSGKLKAKTTKQEDLSDISAFFASSCDTVSREGKKKLAKKVAKSPTPKRITRASQKLEETVADIDLSDTLEEGEFIVLSEITLEKEAHCEDPPDEVVKEGMEFDIDVQEKQHDILTKTSDDSSELNSERNEQESKINSELVQKMDIDIKETNEQIPDSQPNESVCNPENLLNKTEAITNLPTEATLIEDKIDNTHLTGEETHNLSKDFNISQNESVIDLVCDKKEETDSKSAKIDGASENESEYPKQPVRRRGRGKRGRRGRGRGRKSTMYDDHTTHTVSVKVTKSDDELLSQSIEEEMHLGESSSNVLSDEQLLERDISESEEKLTSVAAPEGKLASVVAPERKPTSIAAPEEKLTSVSSLEGKLTAVAAPEEKLTTVAAPEEKLATVTTPEEKLSAVAEPEEKLTTVAAPEETLATVTTPEEKLTAVSEPEEKLTTVAEPEKKLTSVAAPEEKLTTVAVTTPEEKLTAVAEPEEKLTTVAEPEEKLTSVAAPEEKLTTLAVTTPEEKVTAVAESEEKLTTVAEPEEKLTTVAEQDENHSDAVLEEDTPLDILPQEQMITEEQLITDVNPEEKMIADENPEKKMIAEENPEEKMIADENPEEQMITDVNPEEQMITDVNPEDNSDSDETITDEVPTFEQSQDEEKIQCLVEIPIAGVETQGAEKLPGNEELTSDISFELLTTDSNQENKNEN